MKPVVFIVAMAFLLLVSLGNVRQNCENVPCTSVNVQSQPVSKSETLHTGTVNDDFSPSFMGMENFSGKNVIFSLMTL